MKTSKFNIYYQKDNELFIYNTLSGGILHLNNEYQKEFLELQSNLESLEEHAALVENLKKGKMLVDDLCDENEMLIAQSNLIRFSSSAFVLTLAPTMKCNFVCPYCYEVNKSYPKMSRKVIDRLKAYFKEKKSYTNFYLSHGMAENLY